MTAEVQEIRVGLEVQDVSSKVRGIAVYQSVSLNGNIRYGVQPADPAGNKCPHAIEVDVQSLIFVGPGKETVVACVEDTGIELGQEVTDIVTGFKGIATKRYNSSSGCVQYLVMGKATKDGTIPSQVVDYSQLKVTGKGVLADVKKAIKKARDKMLKTMIEPTVKTPRVAAHPPGAPRSKAIRY